MPKKISVRKECLAIRNELNSSQVRECSHIICQQIIASPKYKESKQLFCYMACNNEIDLGEVILHAFSNNKEVFLPKVIGKNMKFYQITSFNDLSEGYFHILEPDESHCREWTANDSFSKSLMLLPGLAFSEKGQRIGYGRGFYDRFLLDNSDFYKIGICYDFGLLSMWDREPQDIDMDEIITEKRKVNLAC